MRAAAGDLPDVASPIGDASSRRFWAYAAAFGAAWGTLEITVGSFLSALRIPFSGTLLASVGVALLVAERQVLPTRGLTLATGVVAAACKTLSPGGAILGPMIGITAEALLVELALLVAPRAAPTAALGGALAALWPLTQKLFGQVVYYGGDILALYLATLRKTAAWLGIGRTAGWRALGVVLAAIVLFGAAAGLIGRRAGRTCRRRRELEEARP
jgi:hypothetical protein